MGKVEGEYKRWYDGTDTTGKSQLFSHTYYKEGKQHGEFKQLYINGQLSIYIKDGKRRDFTITS